MHEAGCRVKFYATDSIGKHWAVFGIAGALTFELSALCFKLSALTLLFQRAPIDVTQLLEDRLVNIPSSISLVENDD